MDQSVIDCKASQNVVVLVRAEPTSPAAQRAHQVVEQLLTEDDVVVNVFFHGDGVAVASQGRASDWSSRHERASLANLLVCQAAWKRRFDHPMAAGFTASTLVRFWQLAIDADSVLSFGGSHAH